MRAQGWAEAEKAKAQRNPAAMREHEQIFGQAPRLWSVSVVACTETDPGTSPRSADGASTESC